MSHAWSLAALAAVLLAFITLESWRPHLVPPAIAFMAAGLLIGPEVLGWVDVAPNAASLRLLAEATLALVLFADASRIDLRALRDGYALPAPLLGIGLPLTTSPAPWPPWLSCRSWRGRRRWCSRSCWRPPTRRSVRRS